jgi:hypothetical protein
MVDPDIFGKPSEGFHSTRFMGLAIYDVIGTIVIALVFTYFTKIPVWQSMIGWFVFGELCHWYFGVKTSVMTAIS